MLARFAAVAVAVAAVEHCPSFAAVVAVALAVDKLALAVVAVVVVARLAD